MGASAPAMQPQQSQSAFAGFGAQPLSPMMAGGGPVGMAPMRATAGASLTANRPNYTSPSSSFGPVQGTKPATPYQSKPSGSGGGSGNFDDLWSMGLGKAGTTASVSARPAASGPAKSLRDLEKEKAQAAIWGMNGSGGPQKPAMGGGFGFSGGSGAAGGQSGGDDLLL